MSLITRGYPGSELHGATAIVGTNSTKKSFDNYYYCNLSADEVTIQAAVDDTVSNHSGGTIFVEPGKYDIRSHIQQKSKIRLVGAGEATILCTTGDNTGSRIDIVRAAATTTSDISLENMVLDGNKANRPTWAVLALYQNYSGHNTTVKGCTFKNSPGDCLFLTTNDVKIHDNYFTNYSDTGIVCAGMIDTTPFGPRHIIAENNIFLSGSTAYNIGGNSEWITYSNSKARQMLGSAVNLQISQNHSGSIKHVKLENIQVYDSMRGFNASTNVSGIDPFISDLKIIDCEVYNVSGEGIKFDPPANTSIREAKISDFRAEETGLHGMQLERVNNIEVKNSRIINAGNHGAGSAIFFNRVSSIIIENNTLEDTQGTPTQRYGISVGNDDTSANEIHIRRNNFIGNASGAILRATNATKIEYNRGYVTENGGAAANVTDGGTINHGLATTPTYVEVTPSIASEMASVTAVGTTNFTVAIKQHDNTAGTQQTIYWRAYYVP